MPSAVIAGLAAGMLPIRVLGDFHPDCRKPFDPRTQVIREHKCAATPLHGAQLAETCIAYLRLSPPPAAAGGGVIVMGA